MSDLEFKPFEKIARLNREVVVTEKLDGTNALVFVGEDGSVRAGSRTRWITPSDDNYGFAGWVAQHADELRALGPGYHYGEWWGQGIQRRYGLDTKRFSLFNVHRWGESRPLCCNVVPVLARGNDIRDATETALSWLRAQGSFAAPGFMNPEGVVIYHTASKQLFKVTLEKDEESKTAAAWRAKQANA
jgi:hypothetical protein